MITATLPIKIESNANSSQGVTRGGRIWRSKKRQKLKSDVALVLGPHRQEIARLTLPVIVLLTRIAPRELDDDNLAFAFKGVRDQIAKEMGMNDRDKRIAWRYAQAKGKPHEYAARIEIMSLRLAAAGEV